MSDSRMSDQEEPVFHKVFIGNFDYDVGLETMERLVEKYGELDHIDMKTGFCFCYFKNLSDARACITDLDGQEGPGRRARRMRVEMARGDGKVKSREELRRRQAEPNKALFVVNFDRDRTNETDLRDYFEKWGPLERVHLTKNYAFVEYERLEDAKVAKEECHGTNFQGHKLTVEYTASNRGERDRDSDFRGSPRYSGGRDRFPGRDSRPAPYQRGSFDRGAGGGGYQDRFSRDRYDRGSDRRSPGYGARRRSPSPRGYGGGRSYGGRRRSVSPYYR